MPANLNTRILVIGGAGFLGSYVVERFRAGGYTETLQNDRVAPTDPGVIPGNAPGPEEAKEVLRIPVRELKVA